MNSQELIRLFMNNDYVSVERLRAQSAMTDDSIRNTIETLVKRGYNIQFSPEKGYFLEPPEDTVWPFCIRSILNTRWAGRHVEYHASVESTNSRARALGHTDAPHGTLVIADEQTAGRGRMSRKWEALPGSSILMSLLLRPEALAPEDATGLVLIAALACAMACMDEGASVRIKWPNDLVVNDKKLCGMLLDMNADMKRVHFAVVGVGVNIHSAPYAEDLTHAVCLEDACGHSVSRTQVVAHFLTHFERLYEQWRADGVRAILPLYREYSVTLGSRVSVASAGGCFEAQALDILEDGALLVRLDGGECIPVRAGDVSVRGVMGYV